MSRLAPVGAAEGEKLLFHDWHERAGVRSGPRRLFAPVTSGELLFSPAAVPEFAHEQVQGLGSELQGRVLTQHLYRYLRYTVHLETRVVNRALTYLATGHLDMDVDLQLQEDALKILADESYHAVSSMDLLRQVSMATGIQPIGYRFDAVLDRLDAPVANPPAGYANVRLLLQASVFETMVTSILDQLPQDRAVHPAIRASAADHAADERLHHAFFVRFFPVLWASLDAATRRVAARDLAALIHACLAPDVASVRAALADAGLSAEAIEHVVADSYPAQRVAAGVRHTARHTVRMLADAGVLDLREGWGAFEDAELLPVSGTRASMPTVEFGGISPGRP